MSLRSMTGYGRGEASAKGLRVEVELNSVNRKQLEVRISLPRAWQSLESRVVELAQESISRGQVSGSIVVHVSEALRAKSLKVNRALAAVYTAELRKTAKALKLKDDLSASLLLTLPEVVSYSGMDQDVDFVWPVMEKGVKAAMAQLLAMRLKEGAELVHDLEGRLKKLSEHLDGIRQEAPQVTERYREALRKRLAQAGVALDGADPVVMKDLALFADRADITEEITRLESHFKQAHALFKSREPVGRTLDFLAQEMFREINTIGSKANEVRITRLVIEFKTELERIREQVQNIE
ncbi:MAG: YicC/YloC family endoribonuclease [bacterium]